MANILKTRSFTLLELIVVIIIIGVLATLALPNYSKMKQQQHDKDATASLKLIMAAERIYRMEAGGYYPMDPTAPQTSNIGDINSNLKLALSSGGQAAWGYTVKATANTLCAQATRTTVGGGSASTKWKLSNTDSEPASGACP